MAHVIKVNNPFLLEQNTKEKKKTYSVSVVKLNFFNLHKAAIMRLKSMEALKNNSFAIITQSKPFSA